MALQSITGGLCIPGSNLVYETTPGFNVYTMNDSNDAGAFIFRIPKAGNIHSIGFRTGVVTTGDTLKVGLYTVDATTGLPTSTAYKGMAVGTQVVADSDDNTWFTVNLGTDATSVVAGDTVAAVVEFNSYVAGNLQLCHSPTQTGIINFPYGAFFEAAWAISNTGPLALYVKYSDGTVAYIPLVIPLSVITAQAFNSGTVGADQYALRFQLPFPARVSGAAGMLGPAGDFNLVLYDSDGTTVLASNSFDKDLFNGSTVRRVALDFTSPVSISKNVNYYLAIKPTTASNVTLLIFSVPEAVAMDQMEGGQNFVLASNVDGGAWTPVTTQRPVFSVVLDQFDDGTGTVVGGSGMLVHPGMQGGCRG